VIAVRTSRPCSLRLILRICGAVFAALFHTVYDRAGSGSEAAALVCPLVELNNEKQGNTPRILAAHADTTFMRGSIGNDG
jgi:hypothetical protein